MSNTMKKLDLHVSGMKCASCEVLIERALKKVEGVSEVQVSRANEEVNVKCSENVNLDDLQRAVHEDGYTLSYKDQIINQEKSKFLVKNKRRYAEIGAFFLFIVGAYLILQQYDLLPKGLGISNNMSYGFIFLIGLIAASSTCLAVSGGLLLAVSGKFNERHPNLNRRQKFQPHIYFNIGRIASYTVLGGAIGLFGSVLTISPRLTGIITIAASIVMIIVGIQLLQIFPGANKIQFKMPKFIAHKLYDAGNNENSTSKKGSFLFGASTFFLPCGFTQALQLYVLGKGDFLTGALTMLAFSLGTLPSLAGIGAFSSFAKGKVLQHFMTFSAVLVIILGLFNMPNGLALAGASITLEKNEISTTIDENVKIIDGKQIVDMKIIGLDYYPHKFKILQGMPVEWRIDGTKAQGCAQVISVPKLGLTEFMPRQGIKTIEFVAKEIGKIPFSCTMGMTTYGAAFEVVPNSEGIESGSFKENIENECNPDIMDCNAQKI